MPKRITLEPHLSPDELQSRYRQASDPVERSHYQIIWLLASGKSPREVAAVTGYSRQWIYELVWGYNRLGIESLGDGRRKNRGADPHRGRFFTRNSGEGKTRWTRKESGQGRKKEYSRSVQDIRWLWI